MATITIKDSVIPRLCRAFGHWDQELGQWVDATPQEVLKKVKEYIRSAVEDFEAEEAALAKRSEVQNESW